MTTPSNEQSLEGLIERVRAATGPDRELDALIATTIGGYVFEKRGKDRKAWFYPLDGLSGRKELHGAYGALSRYTASVDDALALAERVLPGFLWTRDIEGGVTIWHDPSPSFFEPVGTGEHDLAPLAIVLATLTAIQSSETK